MTGRSLLRLAWSCALLSVLAAAGCRRSATGTSGAQASASAAAPELPPLVFKDDTPNVLLTYIDDQGEFHVTEKVADVPEASRGAVRVVLADRTDGTGESIYVADLRQKGADGAYAVKSMARGSWDELGASKRKTRLEALAPSAMPPPAPSSDVPSMKRGPNGEISAVIYGASWCNPCHQAEALLKKLGVKVTKKDIEESDEAQKEMQAVLKRAHRRGGSIPVIDIMGEVMVGFSESAVRAAVEHAKGQPI